MGGRRPGRPQDSLTRWLCRCVSPGLYPTAGGPDGACLIFDEEAEQLLRDSIRDHAAAGEGIIAHALEQLAAGGTDLSTSNRPPASWYPEHQDRPTRQAAGQGIDEGKCAGRQRHI